MSVALLERLLHEVAELKHRLANAVQIGVVAEADATKGYRIDLGVDRDGKVRLSPWMPHPDSGGGNGDWRPLTEGQIVGIVAPGGDLRQGFLIRAGYGGGKAPPSADLGEVVLLDNGSVRLAATAAGLTLTVGGASWAFTAAGSAQTGGTITHDDVVIDKTHLHTGVIPGGSLTGPPP